MKYPHSESLKKNKDFQLLYKEGKSCANRYLVLYVRENGMDQNRFGVSVSKKVGNSVVRHRITRLIRESYRLHEDMFNSGLDMAVIARASAKGRSMNEICSALLHLGKLQGVIQK
ncbi:ribonuclease P protein component [Lachnoclostridium sp. An131]|jgi:ribonuclease P protein component|uniref:ribonuclease P protein component n=1 Tax=Lachnoclostridium sp. An131 TaxID=1965555 RepID=UPI000B37CDD9|nr:ribonuclease P protein component [Lachnoclostridium sp. An131]OUQ28125.1 ribonuclease P protein component [Lachnoclostridium sp. An131]